MYKKILLPIDLGDDDSWRKALPTAVGLCQAFGASLEVLTVVPDMGSPMVAQYFPADYEEKMAADIAAQLKAFAAEHVPPEVPVVTKIGSGSIYKEILEAAADTGVDLIVIGSHRPELSDYLLGPNAARVVRHADCSVMVVRG